jgi:hypothetical protein
MMATSGTRVTSPLAETSSRVPAIGWTMLVWAGAAAGAAIAAAASSGTINLFM